LFNYLEIKWRVSPECPSLTMTCLPWSTFQLYRYTKSRYNCTNTLEHVKCVYRYTEHVTSLQICQSFLQLKSYKRAHYSILEHATDVQEYWARYTLTDKLEFATAVYVYYRANYSSTGILSTLHPYWYTYRVC